MNNNQNQKSVQLYFSNINKNYQDSINSYNNYSQNLATASSSAIAAYQFEMQAAASKYRATNLQAKDLRLASAQIRLTADQSYIQLKDQLNKDTENIYQRAGQTKVAIASSGLAYTGSAAFILDETVSESVRETKNNFLQLAAQEKGLRQSAADTVQKSYQTEQTARANYNTDTTVAALRLAQSVNQGR